MLQAIKNRIYIFTKNSKEKSGLLKLQGLLEDQLGYVVEEVLKDRQTNDKNSNYSSADIGKITNQYMKINVALATASSFVPGPAGLITAVPTMLNTMGNQMKASYDLACAHDKENFMDEDILLNVMLSSRGIPTDTNNFTDKITGLSKNVARKKIRSALSSMIPGLSTIFAVINAKKETMKVVTTSCSIYESPEALKTGTSSNFKFSETQLFEEKLKLLINLLTIDCKTAAEEVSFITPIIKNSTMSMAKKEAYTKAIWNPVTDYKIDFDLIKKSGDADETLVDLAVLSKRDKNVAKEELDYIQYAAKKLDINEKVYQKVLDETYLEEVTD